MKNFLRTAIGTAAIVLAGHAAADATLYEHHDYTGRALTTPDAIEDLGRYGFGNNANAMVITGPASWQVCNGTQFGGKCIVLAPGRYPNLRDVGLADKPWSARPVATPPPPPPPVADGSITIYEAPGFHGRSLSTKDSIEDLRRVGFNDAASSVIVKGERWMVCENVRFSGRCAILRPGLYPGLGSMGLGNSVSSLREMRPDMRVDPGLPMPEPRPIMDWRPRPQERLYDVPVTSVRAVYEGAQPRCWVEREQLRGDPTAGAVVGGLIGGIIGHQFGSGAATVGGAVAGAAIGANVAGGYAGSTNVQRCASVPRSGPPAYWDVTYVFRNVEHRMQTTTPPNGPTIRVNEQGEPRT